MTSLDDILTLLAESVEVDTLGVQTVTYAETNCFCAVNSVNQREFLEAGKQGLKPQYKMTIRREMYGGEKLCSFKGQIYDVYRTYEVGKDYIELYATLKEGERNAGETV